MNKPRWNDKWRALKDMKDALNAAAGTTSPATTTDRHGASGATTMRSVTQGISPPLGWGRQMTTEEYINLL